MDDFTKYLTFAVDFLFIKQPARTSIGLLFGSAAKYGVNILAIWITALHSLVAADIPILGYMLVSLAIFHIPTAIQILSGKYSHLSENEEKVLAMIRDSKATDYEKQQLYLKLVEKVLEKVELVPEMQAELKRLSR